MIQTLILTSVCPSVLCLCGPEQDWNRTWSSPDPDFSACFHSSVLLLLPCCYLWLCAPVYLLHLRCLKRGYICMSRLNRAKTVSVDTPGFWAYGPLPLLVLVVIEGLGLTSSHSPELMMSISTSIFSLSHY